MKNVEEEDFPVNMFDELLELAFEQLRVLDM